MNRLSKTGLGPVICNPAPSFINFLPIPALDGGHLMFYAAEAIRRKPVGPQATEWAYRTGIALVLMLMVVVTVNDIVSLPIFGS